MKPKKKDKKLLYEFCRNSRLSYSELGRKTHISQQLVAYKIKSFKENDIISFSYPLIDYSRFGYLHFRVYFRVNFKSREKFQSLIEKLSENRNVLEVIERGGRYDLIISFAAKNPSSFNKNLKQLIAEYPNQLENYIILTSVVLHYFPKKYMIDSSGNTKDIIIGGDRESIEVGDVEIKLLRELVKNTRSSSVEIANKLGINPRTVISKIRSLTYAGILKGFSSVINLKKIGLQRNKIVIKYHNLSVERENQLRNFCVSNKHITEMNKLFGEFDVEITVETETADQFRDVFIQIREMFEDIIMDSETFSVFRIYRRRFLPEEFFEAEKS